MRRHQPVRTRHRPLRSSQSPDLRSRQPEKTRRRVSIEFHLERVAPRRNFESLLPVPCGGLELLILVLMPHHSSCASMHRREATHAAHEPDAGNAAHGVGAEAGEKDRGQPEALQLSQPARSTRSHPDQGTRYPNSPRHKLAKWLDGPALDGFNRS